MRRSINSSRKCKFREVGVGFGFVYTSHSRYTIHYLLATSPYRGYNIGTRLIEDFLARSGLGRCSDFKEVGEVVAKVRSNDLWLT